MSPTRPASGASVLAELTPDERAELDALGFDAAVFSGLVDAWLGGTLPPNRLSGRVEPPPTIDEAPESDLLGREALAAGRVALVLLNGGMATRFGGRVKGVVDALPGRSFLQLQAERLRAIEQETGRRVPLLLMNSQATDATTRAFLDEHDSFGLDVRCFVQSGAPRVRPDGRLYRDAEGRVSIYGPGHGDLLPSLRRSGQLESLRDAGVDVLLMANVDNLGASLDARLLGHFLGTAAEMMVEAAPKAPGDVGGAPASVDGRVQLVEGFAFPEGFDHDSIPVFNTNTLWFRVEPLLREVPLRWYQVTKKAGGEPVVQFERLVGQATWSLESAFVRVPRSRFLPVKSPADLERIQAALRGMFG